MEFVLLDSVLDDRDSSRVRVVYNNLHLKYPVDRRTCITTAPACFFFCLESHLRTFHQM